MARRVLDASWRRRSVRFDWFRAAEVQSGVPRCRPEQNRCKSGGFGGRRSFRASGSGTGRITQESKGYFVEKDVILTQTGYEKLKAHH